MSRARTRTRVIRLASRIGAYTTALTPCVPSSRSMSWWSARPTATTEPVVASRTIALVACVPQSIPRKTRRIRLELPPGVQALRQGPRVLAARRTDDAAREVVGLHVDPSIQA